MEDQKENNNNSIKTELTRLIFISVGVFLFVLFFQPFPLDTLTYDNRLLYVTGFGGINFLLSFLTLVLMQFVFPKWFKISQWESGPPIFLNIILLALTITAYSFYIRYVGNTFLSTYILFKISLVCLLPIIILGILYKNKSLEQVIVVLQDQNKLYQSKIKEFEKNGKEEKIEILSENKADKLSLKYKDIISIHSADNYIEIQYLDKNKKEKKLMRNTLKNIELQLIKYPEFIRCHRTSIVNVLHIEKMARSYSGNSLKMRNIESEIPVSRQYLILIKDAISSME